jgi:hypothetical protein
MIKMTSVVYGYSSNIIWGFHNVTSGQKVPLGRILRNFRFRMRTLKGAQKGVTWPSVTSGSHGTCTTIVKKKARKCTSGHAQNIIPVSSGHVTSMGSNDRYYHQFNTSAGAKMIKMTSVVYGYSSNNIWGGGATGNHLTGSDGLENDRRGRPREHHKGHFLWKGPTRADIAQFPIAHVHNPSSDLRSLRMKW